MSLGNCGGVAESAGSAGVQPGASHAESKQTAAGGKDGFEEMLLAISPQGNGDQQGTDARGELQVDAAGAEAAGKEAVHAPDALTPASVSSENPTDAANPASVDGRVAGTALVALFHSLAGPDGSDTGEKRPAKHEAPSAGATQTGDRAGVRPGKLKSSEEVIAANAAAVATAPAQTASSTAAVEAYAASQFRRPVQDSRVPSSTTPPDMTRMTSLTERLGARSQTLSAVGVQSVSNAGDQANAVTKNAEASEHAENGDGVDELAQTQAQTLSEDPTAAAQAARASDVSLPSGRGVAITAGANGSVTSLPSREDKQRVSAATKESDAAQSSGRAVTDRGARKNSAQPEAGMAAMPQSFVPVVHSVGNASGVTDGSGSAITAFGGKGEIHGGKTAARFETTFAALPEGRPVETHSDAAPQVEIGIQDPTLGEVRVQAVLDRSGVMHIDVAGRSQGADAVLDQIAPLMHAAVLQQAEAHGQAHTIHVTAAAGLADSGRGGIGSMTGGGTVGVAQGGSMSSSLSSDAQSQQQQRRPQMAAYGTSAMRADKEEPVLPAAIAPTSFFTQPQGQSGLSVRI